MILKAGPDRLRTIFQPRIGSYGYCWDFTFFGVNERTDPPNQRIPSS